MASVNSIYGLFPDADSADRGMHALRAAGIDAGKIIAMSPEPFEEYEFSQADQKSVMPWLAALGGLVGGTCGYLLAWYTQVAYPQHLITGGMPVVAKWPTGIVTYELTMMGVVIATVITLLVTSRLPHWKFDLYDPEISHGKILIGVMDPPQASRADLQARLLRAGAEEVKATGRFESA